MQVLPEGVEFVPDCYTLSDDVLGNPVWLHGTSGSVSGWATDYYIDTHWNTLADLDAQGIPSCDATAAAAAAPAETPAPAGAPAESSTQNPAPSDTTAIGPVDIELYVNGRREQNLLALQPELQAAADAAGVDGMTLARVVYHEGGNYLDTSWRRTATEQAESRLGVSSVGIGQITVATARQVESEVYGGDDSGLDDATVKSRLIHDEDFSIFIAAGYIRLLQDRGLGVGWPQFMGYNMSLDAAQAWKAAGHPMDTASLEALGLRADVEQARQQYYNDAVNAIG
jgi:hypothetical protein